MCYHGRGGEMMFELIVNGILRLLMVILLASDYKLKSRVRKNDRYLKVELTKGQKYYQRFFYFAMILSVFLPFNIYTCIYSIACLVYFFLFTDREIYFNHNSIHFRDTYFQFKKIKDIQYVNNTLSFTYEGKTVRLKKPYCDKKQLLQVIERVQHLEQKQAKHHKHKS